MKIINKPIGYGKTYDLIKAFKKRPGPFIVFSHYQRDWLIDTYNLREEKLDHKILVYKKNIINKLKGYGGPLYIDDVDAILGYIFGQRPIMITLNGEIESSSKELQSEPKAE